MQFERQCRELTGNRVNKERRHFHTPEFHSEEICSTMYNEEFEDEDDDVVSDDCTVYRDVYLLSVLFPK